MSDSNGSQGTRLYAGHPVRNVWDEAEFDAKKRVRKAFYMTENMNIESLYYEPGQGTPDHIHPAQDECFLVMGGTGIIRVDGAEIVAPPGTMVYVPKGVLHGFANNGDERWVLLFFKAPGSTLQALRQQ